MSTTSSGVDLATKFQKLAAEYSKLRAQLPVLKKAVVDEQAKTGTLEEELREKDQMVRTLTTESESLTFRNQQLTKRVEFLQEKLDDTSANNSSPGRFFRKPSLSAKHNRTALTQSISHDQFVTAPGGDPATRALEEELKRKLEENEQLTKEIFELENSHQNEMAAMKNCVRVLETEAESLRNELSSIKGRQDAVLAELRSEKAQLRKDAEDAQNQLALIQHECETNASARKELSAELDDAQRLISERVLFTDNNRAEWNRLDVPWSENDVGSEFYQALAALQPFIVQSLTHLGLFHSYWKQRAQLYPCDTNLGESLSETNTKLSGLLRENANVCRSIESTFQTLIEKCHNGDGFAQLGLDDVSLIVKAFSEYDQFLTHSLPLMRKTMEEECSVGWCNPRLEKENRAFLDAYERFGSSVHELLAPLQSLSDVSTIYDEQSAERLSFLLENVNEAVRGLCDQYSLKIISEHQLPVATRQLRTTNECIAAALNSASKYVGELCRTFRERKAIALKACDELKQRRDEWSVWRRRAIDYNRSINEIPLDSPAENVNKTYISASTSWHNMKYNGMNGGEKDDYESEWKTRLEETQKSLGALEREKEKWVLETQLLKMKLEQSQRDQNVSSSTAVVADDRKSDDSAYVEEYYGNRVAELSSQLQDANSRIIFFQSECQNLLKTIQVYQKQKEKLNGDIKTSSQQIASLKDELETTRKGYETQLSTLSEHLAQMNQRLTKQTDEIDMLRQAMNDKVQKKNRFK